MRAAERRAIIAAAPDLRELSDLTHSSAWLVMCQLVDTGQMVWQHTAPMRAAQLRRLVSAGCAELTINASARTKTLRATPHGHRMVEAWRGLQRALRRAAQQAQQDRARGLQGAR